MIKETTIQTFLNELASRSSTPGGGGAAAIMGAMGAALISMVCNLTIGKKKYEDVEEELKGVLEQAEALRQKLTDAIEADVEVFDRVMASYGMPKDTDAQKAARSEEIQTALKEATDVPLECARLSRDVINLSRAVAEKGNLNLVSDAGVAVMAGYAALKSAALNVQINIGGIKDEVFVRQRQDVLNKLMEKSEIQTENIYRIVKDKL